MRDFSYVQMIFNCGISTPWQHQLDDPETREKAIGGVIAIIEYGWSGARKTHKDTDNFLVTV
jgi:hypothetical protein